MAYEWCDTSAVRLYAIVCYAVAAIAETGGLIFVLLALRENRSVMQRWVSANPHNNSQGSWGQLTLLNQLVPALLGASSWRSRVAAGLVAAGILAGTLGNFASLPG
jgi:hypothetical protein